LKHAPSQPVPIPAARSWLREKWDTGRQSEADRYRSALNKWYDQQHGPKEKFAEAFEICEYGRQPSEAEKRELFPFFEPI
jgi:hypothetical protein